MEDAENDGPLAPVELPEYGLTLLQDTGLGYAGYIWPGALRLCAYLEAAHRQALPGAKVLELGAGCGLGGFFAASCGAIVTITDSEEAVPLLRSNATLNAGCARQVELCPLRFGSDVGHLFKRGAFDFIIGSEVTYFEEVQQALLATLLQLMDEKTVLVLTHGKRHADVTRSLLQMMQTYFEVKEVNLSELDNNWTNPAIFSRLASFVKDAKGGHVPILGLQATLRTDFLSCAGRMADERLMRLGCGLQYPISSSSLEVKVMQSKDIPGFRPLRVSAAGFVLSAYLEKISSKLKGKHVLEVQAGCGFVGLTTAMAGAHVVLTDSSEVLPHLRRNAALNMDQYASVGGSCKVLELEELAMAETATGELDFMIMSDLTVDEDLRPLIPVVVEQLLGENSTLILAHTDRTSQGSDFPWQHYKMLKEVQRHLQSRFEVCVAATTDSVLRGKPELSDIWAGSWAQEIYKERVGLPVTVFSMRRRPARGHPTALPMATGEGNDGIPVAREEADGDGGHAGQEKFKPPPRVVAASPNLVVLSAATGDDDKFLLSMD